MESIDVELTLIGPDRVLFRHLDVSICGNTVGLTGFRDVVGRARRSFPLVLSFYVSRVSTLANASTGLLTDPRANEALALFSPLSQICLHLATHGVAIARSV